MKLKLEVGSWKLEVGRIILVLGILTSNFQLSTSNLAWAGSGKTTAEFLKLSVGGRASAMEGAYSAITDEATALYWNPAGLKKNGNGNGGMAATFMHAVYVEQSYFDYAGFAKSLNQGAVGLGIQYFSAGKITETDITGTDTGSFNPNDLAVTLGYAHKFRGFTWGLGAKYIRMNIIDSADSFAGDFGVITPKIWEDRMKLSLVLRNFGGKIKFDKASESLPAGIRAGSALKISNKWLLALDAEKPLQDDLFAAVGTEYVIMLDSRRALAVRAGFNTKTLGDVGGFTGFAYGLGWIERNFSVDYAIEPLGELSLNHRLSLSLRF